MNRRDFLKYLAGGLAAVWAVVIAVPVLRYLKRPPDEAPQETEVLAAKKDELAPGDSKSFRLGNQPGLLVRDKNGDYRALNPTCTHLACIVQHRKEEGDIFCACHGGIYNLQGKNVSGPPPKPLSSYKVTLAANGDINVSRV